MNTKYLDRITINSEQCGGRPCLRGMRIRVTDILGMLAAGETHKNILRSFPDLEEKDIFAALEYASMQSDHAILSKAS